MVEEGSKGCLGPRVGRMEDSMIESQDSSEESGVGRVKRMGGTSAWSASAKGQNCEMERGGEGGGGGEKSQDKLKDTGAAMSDGDGTKGGRQERKSSSGRNPFAVSRSTVKMKHQKVFSLSFPAVEGRAMGSKQKKEEVPEEAIKALRGEGEEDTGLGTREEEKGEKEGAGEVEAEDEVVILDAPTVVLPSTMSGTQVHARSELCAGLIASTANPPTATCPRPTGLFRFMNVVKRNGSSGSARRVQGPEENVVVVEDWEGRDPPTGRSDGDHRAGLGEGMRLGKRQGRMGKVALRGVRRKPVKGGVRKDESGKRKRG